MNDQPGLQELSMDMVKKVILLQRKFERAEQQRDHALNRLSAAREYVSGLEPSSTTSELLALLSGPSTEAGRC